MDENERARWIGLLRHAIQDTLQAARVIAGRSSDRFSGDEACVLFEDVRKAIAELDDHPAMKALNQAAIPPHLFKVGKET